MSRYSSGIRTSAGSTTLPLASLYAAAAVGGKLREVHIFNTAAAAVAVFLARLTTAGTKPAATTDGEHDPDAAAASCTFHGTHTVGPTIGDDLGYRAQLGPVIGSGVIWTMSGGGIRIPVGVANGIGVVIENGTGQICQVAMVWDE